MNTHLYRMARFTAWIVLFALLVLAGHASVAHAASFTVSNLGDAGPGSLRQAILDANALGAPDTINFTVSGQITLASPLPNITSDLTINGTGQTITISGNGAYRIFYVGNGVSLTLQNLTLANGRVSGITPLYGAAIYNDAGFLTVNTVTFNNNNVFDNAANDVYGGAIYNAGTANLTNVTFTNNTAYQSGTGNAFGGAIANRSGYILNLTNATFTNNSALNTAIPTPAGNGYGGAIYNEGYLTINSSTNTPPPTNSFTNNTASTGGALYNSLAPFTLSWVNFTGNHANTSGQGGAIANYGLFIASIQHVNIANNPGQNCSGDPFTFYDASDFRWPQSDTSCPGLAYADPASTRGVTLAPTTAAQLGDPGTVVTYTLTLTNTGNVADVYSLAQSGNAWTTSAPTTVGPVNGGSTSVTVLVGVNIPAGTPSGTSDVVTITATSQGDPTKTASSTLTTTANSTFAATLAPATAMQGGLPGATVTYTLAITNVGNIADSYNLAATGNAWLLGLPQPPSVGPLPVGANANIVVTTTIPLTATSGTSDVAVISATSVGNPTKVFSSTLTTLVNPIYSFTLTPPTAALSGNVGMPVTYTLHITNTANVTDTFTVGAGPHNWTTSGSSTVGPIAGGNTGVDVPVVVTVPADALNGMSDVVTVTVTSQGDTNQSASSTMTTTASPAFGVTMTPTTAAQSGNPGVTLSYTLYVTNTGNLSDSFNLASTNIWTVGLPTSVGPLGVNMGATVVVTTSVPLTALSGTNDTAIISATSAGDPTKVVSSTLTSTTNAVPGVMLTPAVAGNSGDPGVLITYTVRITNTGNLQDTYDLALSGNVWPSTAPSVVGPLPATTGANIIVGVQIPGNIPVASTDVVTLTATSRAIGNQTANSVMTTSAGKLPPLIGTFIHDQNAPTLPILTALVGTNVAATILVGQPGVPPVATGTVTITVYSDLTCTTAIANETETLSQGWGWSMNPATQVPTGLSYRVTYSGDTNYLPGTGTCTPLTVLMLNPTTTLTSSSNPAYVNQSLTFSTNVSSTNPVVATGPVTFTIDGVAIPTTLNNGAATYITNTLSVGPHTVLVNYGGDVHYNPGTANLSQTINLWTPSVALTTLPGPSYIGQSVTLTARLTSGNPISPTGTVTFTIDAVNIPTTVTNGVATYVTSTLSVATHPVVATYSGDANHTGVTASGSAVVNLYNPVVTLTSSLNPSSLNLPVTFTARITSTSPITPTGPLTFTIDGVDFPTTLTNGVSTYLTTTLPVATHYITATYGGDGNHNTGTANLTQAVNLVPLVITNLNPYMALVNSSAFTMTVTGTGFVPSSTMYWGTEPMSTTFVSTTQLQVAIPASYLTTGQLVNCTIVNPGGYTSNIVPFLVGSQIFMPYLGR